MELEPLKGKWVIEQGDVYQIYGKNMDKQELVNQDCQDLFEDIKSAVEWLKNKIELSDINSFDKGRIAYMIDKAFEDVTKNNQKEQGVR